MTAPTATAAKKTPTPADMIHQAEANEWGQVTGLEPHAQYFVLRRPTAQMTREMSNQMVEDLKAFVAQQREAAEKQVASLNETVLPKALEAAQAAREAFEKRMDQLTKEFESRVEKLESELGERAPKFLRREKEDTSPVASSPATQGAPGELPLGDNGHASAGAPSEPSTPKKKGAKKPE